MRIGDDVECGHGQSETGEPRARSEDYQRGRSRKGTPSANGVCSVLWNGSNRGKPLST